MLVFRPLFYLGCLHPPCPLCARPLVLLLVPCPFLSLMIPLLPSLKSPLPFCPMNPHLPFDHYLLILQSRKMRKPQRGFFVLPRQLGTVMMLVPYVMSSAQ